KAAPIQVQGCVNFNGKLNINVSDAKSGVFNVSVVDYGCRRGAFSNISATLSTGDKCKTASVNNSQYLQSRLVVIVQISNNCDFPNDDGLPIWMIVVIVILAVLVIAGVIGAWIFIRRRNKKLEDSMELTKNKARLKKSKTNAAIELHAADSLPERNT